MQTIPRDGDCVIVVQIDQVLTASRAHVRTTQKPPHHRAMTPGALLVERCMTTTRWCQSIDHRACSEIVLKAARPDIRTPNHRHHPGCHHRGHC